jgi:hypothetical protein
MPVLPVRNLHLSRLHSGCDSPEKIKLILFCSQLQLLRASLRNHFGQGLLIARFSHTKPPLFKSFSLAEPAATVNRGEGL